MVIRQNVCSVRIYIHPRGHVTEYDKKNLPFIYISFSFWNSGEELDEHENKKETTDWFDWTNNHDDYTRKWEEVKAPGSCSVLILFWHHHMFHFSDRTWATWDLLLASVDRIFHTPSLPNYKSFDFFNLKFNHSSYLKICVKYHFFSSG